MFKVLYAVIWYEWGNWWWAVKGWVVDCIENKDIVVGIDLSENE